MPAWLMPAIKAILPHVGTIITATSPAFTRKNADADQIAVLQEQVEELQIAATTNDANIKDLAREIKNTVELLETSAARAESRLRRTTTLALGALLLGVVALICALYALTVA